LGGETSGLIQNILIIKWFDKNELAIPFGINISIARLGTIFNDIFSPRIANVRIK
jgi:hypothetical protein